MNPTTSVAATPAATIETLYPFPELGAAEGYPTEKDFQIIHTDDGRGAGVRTLRALKRGSLISRVSGVVLASRRLHTLQITAHAHLFDPYFSGLLLHSCDPNVFLNMSEFELWALRDISQGEILTMDYASTETVLMRQFQCRCGAPVCRHWITGSKETPNEEGLHVLRKLGQIDP